MKFPAFLWLTLIAVLSISGCQPAQKSRTLDTPSPTAAPDSTATPAETPTPAPTVTPMPLVPNFSHIVMIVFEEKEFDSVIHNRDMPYFNLLADSYTLLTQHYAPAHPSLPNYLAFIGGDTFGITDDCDNQDCYISALSLPNLIESSGRTWKTYQDDMPEPCFNGDTLRYQKKHNPFIFFDSIRLNKDKCAQNVVPLTYLDADIASNNLPNFIFITPDICYSSHDCTLDFTDQWLKDLVGKIYPALDATGETYLIILTWDEGQGAGSCCGLPIHAGGRVATVLISPQARQNFQDHTPYSHYSILKTISAAWGLNYLGHAADSETALITAPWK